MVDRSRPRADLFGGPKLSSGAVRRLVSVQLAFGGLRPLALSAQLHHAGTDCREIVGSTRAGPRVLTPVPWSATLKARYFWHPRKSYQLMMKYVATGLVALIVGIYTTFVAMYMWNWFAVPIFNLPYISFLQMLGLVWLIGAGISSIYTEETKLNFLIRIVELCVPNERKHEIDEIINSMKENLWSDLAIKIFGQFGGNTVTLILGFVLHLFIS